MGNQKPQTEEAQKMQWPRKKDGRTNNIPQNDTHRKGARTS
jgi:hypothetical protein